MSLKVTNLLNIATLLLFNATDLLNKETHLLSTVTDLLSSKMQHLDCFVAFKYLQCNR